MNMVFLGDPNFPPEFIPRLGGKARHLHELLAKGHPVPKGIVLLEKDLPSESDIQKIGGYPVAVRSSASLEDLGSASFAGVYETVLNVRNRDELKTAIETCYGSLKSERVISYLREKNLADQRPRMSILVQRMVDAKVAGVLFTLNPINGFEEEIYLEFCSGLGERLVSGHVTPSRLSYNWKEQVISLEEINAEGTKLSREHLLELITESLRIQSSYGHPQDIEWAIDQKGLLHILQSRPVTAYSARTDLPEVTNADFKDGGISARVCTPLMYSLYREALQISMGDYIKKIKILPHDEGIQWIHYAYGRVYWNAEAVKDGLKRLPGYQEDVFDRDLGIQKDYGSAGPDRTSLSLQSLVSALPVLIALQNEYREVMNMVELFREFFENKDLELKASLGKLSRHTEFSRWFLEVIRFQWQTEKNYFRVIYNNSNFQTDFKNFLKKIPAYQPGDEIDLMGELHGVSHLDMQESLRELVKVADFYGFHSDSYYGAREKFLSSHYHHGPAELDLTVPRWGENKSWVDALVKNFAESPGSRGRYAATRERLASSLSFWKRSKFVSFLDQSRDFLRVREEMRSYSTRAYYLVRLGVLEFARRENIPEYLVFMLDITEIQKKLLDPKFKLPSVDARVFLYDGYRHFKAPNEFGGTIKQRTSASDGELKGIGCSPGEITGRARVITDIHATTDLTKGEILVTLFTDPGWTPVLARVGGVITEVGGLLSHAAVIGREYGIPAVLNLIDATKHIRDGDLIHVNGKSGLVKILEKGSKG